MLSGFVLAHSRLASRHPAKADGLSGVVKFLQKRTANIYPLYATSLVLALAVRAWVGEHRLPDWYVVASQGVLAQSFVPWLPERSVQIHCWFLSVLVPYWLGARTGANIARTLCALCAVAASAVATSDVFTVASAQLSI